MSALLQEAAVAAGEDVGMKHQLEGKGAAAEEEEEATCHLLLHAVEKT